MAEKSHEYALRRQKLSNIPFHGLINITYLPLANHWSFERSPFTEIAIAAFGTLALGMQVYSRWQSLEIEKYNLVARSKERQQKITTHYSSRLRDIKAKLRSQVEKGLRKVESVSMT
ncbi:hypothetical protein BC829DRAFT_415976 [Chytridium lagenaria]|nr:hypothetical protein BC829DRAFT_415976 [Chytridium lagenaria]